MSDLSVKQLSKIYSNANEQIAVLDGLSLEINRGVFGVDRAEWIGQVDVDEYVGVFGSTDPRKLLARRRRSREHVGGAARSHSE